MGRKPLIVSIIDLLSNNIFVLIKKAKFDDIIIMLVLLFISLYVNNVNGRGLNLCKIKCFAARY